MLRILSLTSKFCYLLLTRVLFTYSTLTSAKTWKKKIVHIDQPTNKRFKSRNAVCSLIRIIFKAFQLKSDILNRVCNVSFVKFRNSLSLSLSTGSLYWDAVLFILFIYLFWYVLLELVKIKWSQEMMRTIFDQPLPPGLPNHKKKKNSRWRNLYFINIFVEMHEGHFYWILNMCRS